MLCSQIPKHKLFQKFIFWVIFRVLFYVAVNFKFNKDC